MGKYLDMDSENKEGKTDEVEQTEEKAGAILAPIQIIIPVIDSEEEEEEEEEEEKPKKKKKKKVLKKDKVRNLTLSLGEALSLIIKKSGRKSAKSKMKKLEDWQWSKRHERQQRQDMMWCDKDVSSIFNVTNTHLNCSKIPRNQTSPNKKQKNIVLMLDVTFD